MKINNTKNYSEDKLKILVYGEPGVGKTTLARTIGEPTLIISAEGGLLSLNDSEIDFIDISLDDEGKQIPKEKRITRLGAVYQYLLTDECKNKYKWIFIDSLTEVSQNLIEQLNQEFPERKDSLVMYGENSKRLRSLIKSFRDLSFYNVVFTALSEVEKDENNMRITTVSLVGGLASKVPAFFDEVFNLVASVDPDGKERRILVTGKTDKNIAKDRSGKLNKFEEANLAVIASKIRQKTITGEENV